MMLAEKAISRIKNIRNHFYAAPGIPEMVAGVANAAQDASTEAGTSSNRPRVGNPDSANLPASVYICSACRTPFGAFQGGLSHLSATELGGIAIQAAVERAGVPPNAVGEVFLGNVCSANLGQAPARQAALKGVLPISVDATSVNKVCSSGMKAVALGAQTISLGHHDVVVAGGMESMSNIPHYQTSLRQGTRLGNATIIDGMLQDGLIDATYGVHMGECAERCAEKYGITREQQDAHAIESVRRAKSATADGLFQWEIVSVATPPQKQHSSEKTPLVSEDEAMLKMNPNKLRQLPPVFKKDGTATGTVTAGNASPITDGAVALVLASAAAVRRYNLPVLGKILGFADASTHPLDFPIAPSLAIPKALLRAGITQAMVDYWEINEAFSVVDLVNQKLLGLDAERVNVLGGAVALGHPIGASGARLVVTLLNVLRVKHGTIGVAAVCNGGGGASAMVVKRVTCVDDDDDA